MTKKTSHNNSKRKKTFALKVGIQTYQILTNDDEVCIPSLSVILLAVQHFWLISLLPVLQITIRKILTHTFAPPRYPVKRHQHNFFQVNHKKGGFFFYV